MQYKPIAFEVFRYSLRDVEKGIAAGLQPVFEEAIPTKYDEFFAMCDELGVLQGFEQLTDKRKDCAVPLSALCVLMMIRFLRCLSSFGQMGDLLLRYAPLLERLGISAKALEHGVYNCKRTRKAVGADEPVKVFDEEVFSEVLRDIDEEELSRVLECFIKTLRMWKPGLFREGVFVMDSNGYTVRKTREERKWCALMLLTRFGMIPVAMLYSATEGEGTGETSVGRRLLERAFATYGDDFLKAVLMDAGYLDGESQRWLKFEKGVEWLLPTKEKMVVTNWMLGVAQEAKDWQWREVKPPQLNCPKNELPTRKILWIENIGSYPDYGAKVNGIVIRDEYPASAQHPEGKVVYQCVVTSALGLNGTEIHSLWRKRWSIENAFGFMTDFWGLGKWQIRNREVYRATIQFMALTYGLVVLQHTREQLPLSLTQLKYRFERQAHNMVLIRVGDACALLTSKTLNEWMMRGILVLRAP